MSFWLGVAVGFTTAVVIFFIIFIFALAKTSGRGSVEEDEEQLAQLNIQRQQQIKNRRAQIHLVVR